jgi:hypothetical protein
VARVRQWFKPGNPKGVGVISRSGGIASRTGYFGKLEVTVVSREKESPHFQTVFATGPK